MVVDVSIHMSIGPVLDIFNWPAVLGDCHDSRKRGLGSTAISRQDSKQPKTEGQILDEERWTRVVVVEEEDEWYGRWMEDEIDAVEVKM